MTKEPKATEAQAKVLARLFSNTLISVSIPADNDPKSADRVIVRNGWADPWGEKFEYPNGSPAQRYRGNEKGEEALLRFLLDRSHKRMAP